MRQDDLLWIAIGSLSDIPQRGARCVEHSGKVIAIFRSFEDEIFALEDICTNCDGPISQGIVSDRSVSCPICNWEIDLKTGQALGADVGQVQTYAIQRQEQDILLGLPLARGVA